MSRSPAAESGRARFATLLARHLAGGTRPATEAGEPLTDAGFAGEVQSSRDDKSFASPRSVSNWRKGAALPDEIEPILRALFGAGSRHAAARDTLRAAFVAARAEKYEAVVGRAQKDPAGTRWAPGTESQLVRNSAARPSDQRAAADPQRQQMQAAIRRRAAELVGPSQRLANSRTWGKLAERASALLALVEGDPLAMPDRLADAYDLLLLLGGYLETDIRVRHDPLSTEDRLDADIHGLLTALVRLAAPWLRGFPTVAEWDDAAGKTLVRPELFEPARSFARKARTEHLISEHDANAMQQLVDAAGHGDFQGEKSGNRAIGDTINLILATAELWAGFLAAPDSVADAALSLLLQRARATLAVAAPEVAAFAATRPDDLKQALQALSEDAARSDSPVQPKSALLEPPVPDDVEAQARAMILAGQAPPAAWCPFIHELNFFGTRIASAEPLAGLTALQSLNLRGTQVSDVSPLAGLTALQSLDLRGTQVSDVSALAGLTALRQLDLTDTQVSDVSALEHLPELKIIGFAGRRKRTTKSRPGRRTK